MDDSPETRIPAHLEVQGLIRAVEAAGGFATVLATGEHDAGTLLVVCCGKGRVAAAYERMPHPDGARTWVLARREDPENPHDFWDYCTRRGKQDKDLWVLELDIPDAERFIDLEGTSG